MDCDRQSSLFRRSTAMLGGELVSLSLTCSCEQSSDPAHMSSEVINVQHQGFRYLARSQDIGHPTVPVNSTFVSEISKKGPPPGDPFQSVLALCPYARRKAEFAGRR